MADLGCRSQAREIEALRIPRPGLVEALSGSGGGAIVTELPVGLGQTIERPGVQITAQQGLERLEQEVQPTFAGTIEAVR